MKGKQQKNKHLGNLITGESSSKGSLLPFPFVQYIQWWQISSLPQRGYCYSLLHGKVREEILTIGLQAVHYSLILSDKPTRSLFFCCLDMFPGTYLFPSLEVWRKLRLISRKQHASTSQPFPTPLSQKQSITGGVPSWPGGPLSTLYNCLLSLCDLHSINQVQRGPGKQLKEEH